jgi:hypothetical protein
MKVLNLQCRHAHDFEGWFASEDDFQSQLQRGLVECPVCGDTAINKLPSAPRLNLSGAREAPAQAAAAGGEGVAAGVPASAELQALWMQAVQHVLKHTEDVGDRFAEEARRIHYGETDARGIRGQATREDTLALIEEGVEVMPLPLPAGLKGPVQ